MPIVGFLWNGVDSVETGVASDKKALADPQHKSTPALRLEENF
jgi:hypothetical protein